MLTSFEVLAQPFVAGFELFWVSNTPAGALALIGVVGLAAIAFALCARYLTAGAASSSFTAQLRHPREPADVAALLSQSDPDADGHARPRAPAFSLAAV